MIDLLLILIPAKPEISGFETVGKQDIKKGNDRVNLCEVGGDGRLRKDQRQTEVHDITQEAPHDRRYAIPQCLPCQLFNAAQIAWNLLAKVKVNGNE